MSSVMVSAITADISSLLTDADTATTATFTTPTGSTLDPATGQVARTSDQDEVTGWLAPLTEREAGDSGIYRVGDQRLVAPASAFTRAPNTDSSFSVNAVRYSVIGVETASLGSAL